jgi:hypothetical protein
LRAADRFENALDEAVQLAKSTVGKRASFELNSACPVPLIQGMPVRQVTFTLLLNALGGLPDGRGQIRLAIE